MTQFLHQGSPMPPFYIYPKYLLAVELSETTKTIYMLLLDRARLSMQNKHWQDEQGQVFVHYTISTLATAVGKCEMTVKNSLKELEQNGLIIRKSQGAGKPNRIYVRIQTESCLTARTISYSGTDRKLSPNNKKNNKEFYIRDYAYQEGESL